MMIEKADLSDTEELVKLRLAYLTEDHGELNAADRREIQERLPAYFRAHLNRDFFCWLIREGDAAVSCAFLTVTEKPMSPAFINGLTGTVMNVYTDPSFRGRGYASAIMKQLIREADQMRLCRIDLKATDAGYEMYRKAGFEDDGGRYHLMTRKNSGL